MFDEEVASAPACKMVNRKYNCIISEGVGATRPIKKIVNESDIIMITKIKQ